jgi:hypothetical protein
MSESDTGVMSRWAFLIFLRSASGQRLVVSNKSHWLSYVYGREACLPLSFPLQVWSGRLRPGYDTAFWRIAGDYARVHVAVDLSPEGLALLRDIVLTSEDRARDIRILGISDEWIELCERAFAMHTPKAFEAAITINAESDVSPEALDHQWSDFGGLATIVGKRAAGIVARGRFLHLEGGSNPGFYRPFFSAALREHLEQSEGRPLPIVPGTK